MALTEKWIASVEAGVKDARWDDFDITIKAEVAAYNTGFASSAGFSPVSRLAKVSDGHCC